MKSNCSRYLRDLRRLMPVYGKSQREYLHAIDQSIEDYCNSHPNPTYEELTDHFGAPQEIIGDYLRGGYPLKSSKMRIRSAYWWHLRRD